MFAAVLEGASKQLVSLMLGYGGDIKSQKFQRKSAYEVASERGFTHLLPLLDLTLAVEHIVYSKVEFTFNFCAMCRKTDIALVPCQTCGLVAYCGDDCKAKHWKVGGHKDICNAVLSRMGEDEDEE
jgi:hypothetical protein